jgi:hypothetical protein
VVWAIDGTAVPMQPSKEAAGGDTDVYWCYKGYAATLLLGVVDNKMLFTYINVGALGNIGDAGLYGRSMLKRMFDDGLLRGTEFELPVRGRMETINPYMVGDSTFPLGPHLVKCFDLTSAQLERDPVAAMFNRRVINCRRKSKMVFCRLKGRWAFSHSPCYMPQHSYHPARS